MEAVFPRVLTAGEACWVVEFGDSIDMAVNARVQALRRKIESAPFPGFIETVPTYRSLAVCFNPMVSDGEKLKDALLETAQGLTAEAEAEGETVLIPVCYEGELAPDLPRVAEHTGLSEEEVVRRHTANDCYCYMLGFTPGFSYLGGMDPTLETPRLKEPREKIPAGSVGIAAKQTGIYPIDSPGGWNLIGRTPLTLFDPDRPVPIFLNAGMWVRFYPVGPEEFARIKEDAARPDWKPEMRRREADA
ncbi:MAG: 5-oxoprolinase subunit PxpB [Fretibacterium sp.]|nr:5-oxoprolinase subunit PxpB [Fretibacterium sp.]